jgi:hypothetical protein
MRLFFAAPECTILLSGAVAVALGIAIYSRLLAAHEVTK